MMEFSKSNAFFTKKQETLQKRRVWIAAANFVAITALVSIFLVFVSCSKKAAEAIDFSTLSEADLIAGAQKEGELQSVGLPDDWADFKDSWEKFQTKYGIKHYDVYYGSAEVVQLFKSEGESGTKDLGNVGQSYGLVAISEDVVRPFKAATWDKIPDWAKDPDGKWVVHHTGTLVFTVNTDKTGGVVPQTWKELKELLETKDLKVTVGDVVSSSAAQVGVLSAALANGGGLDNVQPGIDYFKDIVSKGHFDPGNNPYQRFQNGEITVLAGRYDFTGLEYRDEAKESGGPNIEVTVPQDGAVTSGYALLFNKYSPHPYTTALAIDYLLSDEAQIDRARGYARPIKTDVVIPDDVKANLLPEELYANATIVKDNVALNKAQEEIAKLWQEQVVPLMK